MPLVNMIDNVIVIKRLTVAGFTPDQALSAFGQLTGMAMSIINLPSVITVAMSMSLVPAISEAFALGNKSKARKDTKKCYKSNFINSFYHVHLYGFTCNTYNAIIISKRANNCRNYTFIPYTLC